MVTPDPSNPAPVPLLSSNGTSTVKVATTARSSTLIPIEPCPQLICAPLSQTGRGAIIDVSGVGDHVRVSVIDDHGEVAASRRPMPRGGGERFRWSPRGGTAYFLRLDTSPDFDSRRPDTFSVALSTRERLSTR